jgi:Lar family restriction alleviation protein
MLNPINLEPCPFCGGTPEADYTRAFRQLSGGRLDQAAAIYCTSCDADMSMCRSDFPELTDEERMSLLVEKWNRRAPASPVASAA